MADLILSQDSKQYQDLARDFSRNEIAPRSEKVDHTGELPSELWKKAWEIGLVNVRVPEEFGGLGLGLLDACVIAEELGAGCAGISAAFWGNDLGVAPLLVAGNKARQERYLPSLLSEFSLAGYCFDEGSTLKSKREGNGYLVSGTAICVNAQSAAFIYATAGNDIAFVVPGTESGIAPKAPAARVGLKGADLQTVEFKNVRLSDDNIVGKAEAVEQLKESVRVFTAPLMAAYATGIARAAMEHAVRYSKERHTFGVPIANHQAVGFMLADMAKNIEASRLLTHKAAWLADRGEGDLTRSLTARHFATEMAITAATDAVQVFGGYGYSREYPVEKLMRDAKMLQVLEGNAQQTRLHVGKELIGSAK